jgi:N-hydroxyarylamine O-acetyltransferase
MSLPDAPLGPRVHMLLKVDLPQGPYLADVGFGAHLVDTPFPFVTDTDHRTGMGTFRLTQRDGHYWLSAKQPGGPRTMYVFDLAPQLPSDYELGNWFTATNSYAPFTSMLIMERLAPERRYKLINRRFVTEARDGEVVSEQPVESAAMLGRILDETFGVTPPVAAAELFAKVPE